MTTPRIIAAQVLERIEKDDAYSHLALSAALDQSSLDSRDKALVTELVYGTLTWQRPIDVVLGRFVNRRLDKLDLPLLLALRLAAYQLIYLDRIPEHAAVNEAVDYVKDRRGRGAAGFANGALRAMLRKRDRWDVLHDVDKEDSPVTFLGLSASLPDWIARRLLELRGDSALEEAQAFNRRPPLYYRSLSGVDHLPKSLQPVEHVPGAYLSHGTDEEIDAALREKRIVIQDLGSQLIGHYVAPPKRGSLLDACAGLGGKTLHLASLSPKSTILAVEPQNSKLELLQTTLEVAQISAKINTFVGTLKKLPSDQGPFDVVLIDAPCSGLGVIRRHPETRWRRHPRDLRSLVSTQQKLLQEGAKRVAPSGLLVYSVCTFTEEEGPEQIARFLEQHPDFEREAPPTKGPVSWKEYLTAEGDLSLFPGLHDTDAFYGARLRRKKAK